MVYPYKWKPKQINACVLDSAGLLIIVCIVISGLLLFLSYKIHRTKKKNILTRKKKLIISRTRILLLLLIVSLTYLILYNWCGENIEAVYENKYFFDACHHIGFDTLTDTYIYDDARCQDCQTTHDWLYKKFDKYLKIK